MKKEKILIVDVDGVIIDWEYGFHIWMETHGHIVDDSKSYNMDKKYALMPGVGLHQIQIFNESAAMGFLPPIRDAQYYVKLLHEKHMYRFVAVTSMGDDEYAVKLREKNLSKLFGPNTFKELHCLPCGAYKDEIFTDLAKKYRQHVLVEDNIDNAECAAVLDYRVMLMSHGYNFDYSSDLYTGKGPGKIQMVLNWEEIYNEIIQTDASKT